MGQCIRLIILLIIIIAAMTLHSVSYTTNLSDTTFWFSGNQEPIIENLSIDRVPFGFSVIILSSVQNGWHTRVVLGNKSIFWLLSVLYEMSCNFVIFTAGLMQLQ